MKAVRLTSQARRDLLSILEWSDERFGRRARGRYQALINRAVLDLRRKPDRIGVVTVLQGEPAICIYHLRHSNPRASSVRVGRPRHLIAFWVEEDALVIFRVLHDAMDIPPNLGLD